jgi:hypothetical protein
MVARLCRVYGWTPDYCLDHLSWPQVLMYDNYADGGEMTQRPPASSTGATTPTGGDEPDAAAIEQAFKIRGIS